MAVDWDYLIASMETFHYTAYYNASDCDNHIDTAWVKWGEANYNSCLYWTLTAVNDLEYGFRDTHYRWLWGENGNSMMIPTAFRTLKGIVDGISPEITLNDILAAMLTATPEQVEQFIGTVDAFRTSMWNRPFDVEYFALLARTFAQWE